MNQKENILARKKIKDGMTITADVSDVLKVINNNIGWKNNSSKLTKNNANKTIHTKTNTKNIMT